MRDYDGKTAVERVAERRERLIDAGTVLFGDVGYADTSIRAVLRHAGLQVRYYGENFADLDELLAAVYTDLVNRQIAACREAMDATPGGTLAARALMQVSTRMIDKDPRAARITLREVLGGGSATRKARQAGMFRWAELFAEQLPVTGRRRRRGEPERFTLALGLAAAGNELLIAWLDGELGITRGHVVEGVMAMFDALTERLTAAAK